MTSLSHPARGCKRHLVIAIAGRWLAIPARDRRVDLGTAQLVLVVPNAAQFDRVGLGQRCTAQVDRARVERVGDRRLASFVQPSTVWGNAVAVAAGAEIDRAVSNVVSTRREQGDQLTAAEQARRAKQLLDMMSGATGVDLWSKAMETP